MIVIFRRRTELTSDSVYSAYIKQDRKYENYEFKEIDYFHLDYFSDYVEVEEVYSEKKFFGLFEVTKTRTHILTFMQGTLEQRDSFGNVNEYLISHVADDFNKVVYWKLIKNLTRDRIEREQEQARKRQRYEQEQRRWQQYEERSKKVSQLQEHLNFLNIGNKSYNKESLKAHYRKLSKKYHPDMPNGDEEMMKKINNAYEYIMNTL